MCQTSEMFGCPHFNTAMTLFLKLPTNELNQLLRKVVHQSGYVKQFSVLKTSVLISIRIGK